MFNTGTAETAVQQASVALSPLRPLEAKIRVVPSSGKSGKIKLFFACHEVVPSPLIGRDSSQEVLLFLVRGTGLSSSANHRCPLAPLNNIFKLIFIITLFVLLFNSELYKVDIVNCFILIL